MKNEQDFMKMAIRLPGSGLKEMLQRLLQGGQELGGRAVQGTKNFVNPMLDMRGNYKKINMAQRDLDFAKGIHGEEYRGNAMSSAMERMRKLWPEIDRGKRNLAITGGVTAGGTVGGLGINELIKATRDKQASAPDFMKLAISGTGLIKAVTRQAAPAMRRVGPVIDAEIIESTVPGALKRTGSSLLRPRNLAAGGALAATGAGAYGLGSHRGYEQGGQAGFGLGQRYGMANAANTQQQSGFLSRLMDMFAPSGNRSLQGAQMAAWDPRLLRVMREQQRAAKS